MKLLIVSLMILVHLHSCKKMGDNNKYIVDSVDCYNSQNNYQNACVIFTIIKEKPCITVSLQTV